MANVDNNQDVIDSRDIIARIEELDALREAVADAEEALCEYGPDGLEEAQEAFDAAQGDFSDDEREELDALESLAEEASGYASDWKYGETLIRDSYFTEYAQELAEDIGAIADDAKWPCTCIDWEQAARELQMDYTAVDFAGVTYWIR